MFELSNAVFFSFVGSRKWTYRDAARHQVPGSWETIGKPVIGLILLKTGGFSKPRAPKA